MFGICWHVFDVFFLLISLQDWAVTYYLHDAVYLMIDNNYLYVRMMLSTCT